MNTLFLKIVFPSICFPSITALGQRATSKCDPPYFCTGFLRSDYRLPSFRNPAPMVFPYLLFP